MATTTGLVLHLRWANELSGACFFIGSALESAEIFAIQLRNADADRVRDYKKSMIALLAKAQQAGYPVIVAHAAGDTEITRANIPGFDISPAGLAIHGDLYSVTGRNIPAGAEVVLESEAFVFHLTPDFVQPHLVCVAELSASIPPGRYAVRLQAPGWSSQAVPVDVSSGPPQTVRVLHGGPPKVRPYTIVFVANPAIENQAGGTFSADPMLGYRSGFNYAVIFCLRQLFTLAEDLMRQGHIDASIRLVTIFDNTADATEENALAREVFPGHTEPQKGKLNSFVGQYFEKADIVLVLNNSATHGLAMATSTTDDAVGPSTGYILDGTARVHGHLAEIPGSATIHVNEAVPYGVVALHEFLHAASDYNNGRVVDLYRDGFPINFDGTPLALQINKKFRANSTDPIPVIFANYNGTDYLSDQNRDGIGYDPSWLSYHPALIDPARPNIMDNYQYLTITFEQQRCRLDQLTYAWYVDRLWAKVHR